MSDSLASRPCPLCGQRCAYMESAAQEAELLRMTHEEVRRRFVHAVSMLSMGWRPAVPEVDMTDDQKIQAAVEHVGTYLALKAQIAELEEKADEAKVAVCAALEVEAVEPGKVWTFEGLGKVQKVKGRVSEKLDRAVLARAGVAVELLDKATVRKEGEPSVRISAEGGDAE